MTVPDAKVMGIGRGVDLEQARKILGPLPDEILEAAASGRELFYGQGNAAKEGALLKALGASSPAEGSWEIQRLRGVLAKQMGFKAIAMPDEHGVSYLVPGNNGVAARPLNDSARAVARGTYETPAHPAAPLTFEEKLRRSAPEMRDEFSSLSARLDSMPNGRVKSPERIALSKRVAELERQIRGW